MLRDVPRDRSSPSVAIVAGVIAVVAAVVASVLVLMMVAVRCLSIDLKGE